MNRRRHQGLIARGYAVLLVLLVAVTLPPATSAQTSVRYFSETGHYLKGAFRYYWETNGGLQLFGFPVSEEFIRSADGRLVQYFERARFELVGSGANSFVELGRIGTDASGNRIFPQIPPFATPPGGRYFYETSHSLIGLFRRTWETRGALRTFGYPISEEIYERLEDGQFRLVQYFERARFELWPEGVRFGRLGAALAPPQLTLPWPPNIQPPGPLNEEGFPRPPEFPFVDGGRGTVTVSPLVGRPGQSFQVAVGGFRPGEKILLWLTRPDGVVQPLNQVPTVDGNGVFTFSANVGFDTGRRDPQGIWYVTAQGLTSGRLGVAAFTLDSDFSASPQQPSGSATVRVVPGSGNVGTTFTLEGEGFKAREDVSVWLTAPDGAVRPLTQALRSDGSGSISAARLQFTIGAGSLGGRWLVTAQGRESGFQGIGSFNVGSGGGGGAPVPPGSGGTGGDPNGPLSFVIHEALGIRNGISAVTPLAAAPGASFRLNLAGFAGGERVSVWLTAPNSQVEGVDGRNVQNDGRGNLSAAFTPSSIEGDWKLTAQGITSRRTVIVPFKVTRDYIAPPGTPRPPNRNGNVTPAEGGRGTTFQFTGTGLRANEPVDHWVTSPDGIYYLVGRSFADSRGRVGYTQTLAVQFGERNPPGVYGYHYKGVNSGVRIDLYLTYTGN